MREHALRVREYAPPIADHMTVCSERQKAFWIRAGADASTITVTGQPRFDRYAEVAARGHGTDGPPTAVFFSYQVDAYHPTEGSDAPVWRELHRQTELGLWQLAEHGWRILIKPHPQQGASGALPQVVAALPRNLRERVQLVPGERDTRELICDADVVIGFQTTAMLEAMVAGKPVLYTGWDPEAHKLAGELIPLSTWDGAIDVLRAPEDLPSTARARLGCAVSAEAMARRRAEVERFLGPIDGAASQRTLDTIRRVADEFAAQRSPEATALRARLSAARPPLRVGRTLHRKLDGGRELVRRKLMR
jgi:hypothetical protein